MKKTDKDANKTDSKFLDYENCIVKMFMPFKALYRLTNNIDHNFNEIFYKNQLNHPKLCMNSHKNLKRPK